MFTPRHTSLRSTLIGTFICHLICSILSSQPSLRMILLKQLFSSLSLLFISYHLIKTTGSTGHLSFSLILGLYALLLVFLILGLYASFDTNHSVLLEVERRVSSSFGFVSVELLLRWLNHISIILWCVESINSSPFQLPSYNFYISNQVFPIFVISGSIVILLKGGYGGRWGEKGGYG